MEWVVRAGEARPEYLVSGYGPHRGVSGLYGFSVQFARGKTVDELARAGQFPNAQISYATDDALSAGLAKLGYSMRLIPSPGQGYHHTFAVVYDANGVMLTQLPLALAVVISQTFQRGPNPYRAQPESRRSLAMRRIPVDFNTLTSAPVGVVKFHAVAPLTGESHEDLVVGERVELFEEEATTALVVQATITERWHELWLATPIPDTWHDVPLAEGRQARPEPA